MSSASSSARAHLTLVPLTEEVEPESSLEGDRRVHPRHTLSELDWLSSVRLKYGPMVSLIDLSTGGAQIETTNRLQPGSTVVVQIAGPDGEVAVPSSVLRCQVSRVVPQTMYRSSLSFKRAFEPPRPTSAERGSDVVANLIQEHARIATALRHIAVPARGTTPETSSGLTAVGEAALAATLAMIESPSAQSAGAGFRKHMTQVFRALTRDIEAGTDSAAMLSGLAELLRRSVPAKTIRIVDAGAPIGRHRPDTIYFDATADGRLVARLIVEFPGNCHLEEWHLQFLKTAAQLVTLVSEVAQLRAARTIAPPEGKAAAADRAGWEPLVVRYTDGRLLKGYGHGFLPARGHLQVWPEPDAPMASVITVLLRHLKAVFFVHDLDGAPANLDPTPPAKGRKIIVTFLDGEALTGTTLNYTPDGPGFFLSPIEERGNNVRIFVVTAAIRHVQFP